MRSTVAGIRPLPFHELSFTEARRFLEEYVAGIPLRINSLKERVAGDGGPASALDGSPESLDQLWTWFRNSSHEMHTTPRESEDNLPIWLPHVTGSYSRWGAQLLRDADLLAAYASVAVLLADPSGHWAVGHAPARFNYIDQHWPVLTRDSGDRGTGINPIRRVSGAIGKVIILGGDSPRPLRLVDFSQLPGSAPQHVAEFNVDDLEIEVGEAWEEPFDATVEMHEMTEAVVGEDVFAALEDRVAAAPGIDEAVHVDREVLHVRSRLPHRQIEQIVRDALRGVG